MSTNDNNDNANNNQNGGDQNGGGNAGGSNNGSGSDNSQNQIDISKLTDDQAAELFKNDKRFQQMAFEHPRFKELGEKAKKADEYETAAQKAEREKLEQEGKWKELAEKSEAEKTALEKRVESSTKNAAIIAAAAKAGVTDPNDAVALVDKSKLSIGEDGTVSGADDLVKALVESKPYLTSTTNKTDRLGSGSSPSGNANDEGAKTFTFSEIQNPEFYQKNKKDIDKAVRLGLVDMTK